MRRSLAALTLALTTIPLASTCAPAGSSSTSGLPSGAYVLSGEQAALLLMQCSRGTPARGEGTFSPDVADISALEAALAQALMNRGGYPPNVGMRAVPMPGEPDFARAPQGWGRQYAGIVRGGRRYIYGNFFPAAQFPDTRQRALYSTAVVVCDGGPAFFGAEWDVEARKFTHLAFNGMA